MVQTINSKGTRVTLEQAYGKRLPIENPALRRDLLTSVFSQQLLVVLSRTIAALSLPTLTEADLYQWKQKLEQTASPSLPHAFLHILIQKLSPPVLRDLLIHLESLADRGDFPSFSSKSGEISEEIRMRCKMRTAYLMQGQTQAFLQAFQESHRFLFPLMRCKLVGWGLTEIQTASIT